MSLKIKHPMRFDPITKQVYTNNGEFIKKMHCPYKINWDNLEATSTTSRKCSNCDHLIIDTEYMSDDELLHMVTQNPDTCLKLDLNQHNLQIISNGILEQK
jgi:hypothetical protein